MHQQERKRILEKAGYVHVNGWLPQRLAKEVKALIRDHAEDVSRTASKKDKDT